MGQILSILWEIVLFSDILKICIKYRKILVCPKNFWTPKMVHWPKLVHWPRSSKIILSGKFFLALKAPTTSRFLIIWTWQLCTMAIRSLHGLSANFTLTPPLFKPPRYGPGWIRHRIQNIQVIPDEFYTRKNLTTCQQDVFATGL